MGSYARTGTCYDVGLHELGTAILQDAFRCAAKQFLAATTFAWETQTIAQSVAFVQGSGLETIIQAYHLDLDPMELRSTFHWKLRHCHQSTSHNGLTGRRLNPLSTS